MVLLSYNWSGKQGALWKVWLWVYFFSVSLGTPLSHLLFQFHAGCHCNGRPEKRPKLPLEDDGANISCSDCTYTRKSQGAYWIPFGDHPFLSQIYLRSHYVFWGAGPGAGARASYDSYPLTYPSKYRGPLQLSLFREVSILSWCKKVDSHGQPKGQHKGQPMSQPKPWASPRASISKSNNSSKQEF